MKRTARFLPAAVAMIAAITLTACTVAGTPKPAVITGTVPAVSAATPTEDQAAARSSSMASVASAQAVADKAAAEQAAAGQSAAAQAAEQSAAEKAAAEQSAAEQAAAEQVAEQSAAEESAAAESAAEQSAADQSAADQASADADVAANGWHTPSGNWVSPETAARALAAGIAAGDSVPDYLRCGTICGEGPTSGEVQTAHACKDGLMTADECAGIDPDAIIAAASSYSGG